MTDQTATAGIVVPVDEVLDKLGHGNNWIQGAWDGPNGSMCLHQGIRACQTVPGDAHLIEQVAREQGWGTSFNDATDTQWADVEAAIVGHPEILPDELEAVFGPQWEPIVALVRRAAVLTSEERQQLNAARDAALAAARAAAWAARSTARDAARAAAGDAVRAAVRDAAGDAVRAAVRDAARAAVRALSVRDLIGDTFTQDHYDTLTGPWAAVIGPVHPDDKAVTR